MNQHKANGGRLSRSLSNKEAARDWSRDLVTRSGTEIHVRPAVPGDETGLAEFFRNVTPGDLYRRYLTAIHEVDRARLRELTRDDDPLSIDFLAIDPDDGTILATAMLATDRAFDIGEFAVCTRDDAKHQGISWTLLDHLVAYATEQGIARLQSIETWDDPAAMTLERDMGFTLRRDPRDAKLVLAEKQLAQDKQ